VSIVQTIEIMISGRVQNIGFRACVRRFASSLGVTGEVMNLSNGQVCILATADQVILEKFISMLYGCPRAVIRDLQVRDIKPRIYDDFLIQRVTNQ
jgi:acylphosphatase